MRKSVEKGMRVVGATLALTGAIGETATGTALASQPGAGQPSIGKIAHRIAAQRPQESGKGPGTFTFEKALPNGQEAVVTLSTTSEHNGKPDIKKADAVDVLVYIPIGHLNYITPVADYTFTKMPNNTWSAYRQKTNPTETGSTLDAGEEGQTSVSSDTEAVINDMIVNTDVVKPYDDANGANRLLHRYEGQAAGVLKAILHGLPASPNELH